MLITFFWTDQIQQGNVVVKYCPIDIMTGDYMKKPLQGIKFQKFKKAIMGQGGCKICIIIMKFCKYY